MRKAEKRKLIEVSLPLEAINAAAKREKSSQFPGHPSKLHSYWARRPLAIARAVLFAQLVDDPSSRPEEFPTAAAQDAERTRLHVLLEQLVDWDNLNDQALLAQARDEIRKSNNGLLPTVLDPFVGGGAIPLEAQRLGLEAHASDLNPLAVLLNKAMIELPPRLRERPPTFPGLAATRNSWLGVDGLAADVRAYGKWLRDEAYRQIGHLYPKVKDTDGNQHTVIAWIWARTVKSPNPANPIEVPLVSSWWLSKKKGKEAWVDASVVDGEIKYEVRHDPDGPQGIEGGTVRGKKGGFAIGDGTPISMNYIRAEGCAGRIGAQLITVVADGHPGRLYLSPSALQAEAANVKCPGHIPAGKLGYHPRNIGPPFYGMTEWADLFTNRQLVALTTLSDLVSQVKERVLSDVRAANNSSGGGAGREEDNSAEAYADAVAIYLALAVGRTTDYSSSLCGWISSSSGEVMRNAISDKSIPMVWDYAEGNPFSSSTGNFLGQVERVAKVIEKLPANATTTATATATQADAADRSYGGYVISTDPPYYDNISYADLSDYFYVWLRPMLKQILPDMFATLLTPKRDELIANRYRHNGKEGAEEFFINGFNSVFARMRDGAHADVPLTVYYAYKQHDADAEGNSSTGWYTLLSGLIDSGWEITATWPVRSEKGSRKNAQVGNTLASSIVLACRPRPTTAAPTSRRTFIAALKAELPAALRTMMQGQIEPVDLEQAAIGPGIAVFSRYSGVRAADGTEMSVRDALLLINTTLDEVLGEQASDFDPITRFAVKWHRQYGWRQASAGIADQLARSSNTAIDALAASGIFIAKGGKAQLLGPSQLADRWDPAADSDVSVWAATMRLAAVLDKDGVESVVELLQRLPQQMSHDAIKHLGYLLFHDAEKQQDTEHALMFNKLVAAWGEISERARTHISPSAQDQLDFGTDEG